MISIKLAKKISIEKWKMELSDSYSHIALYEKFPDIFEDSSEVMKHYGCGFCFRHGYSDFPRDIEKCKNCEIAKSDAKSCLETNSLYNQIQDINLCCDNELMTELIEKLISIIENIDDDE